MHPAIGFLAPNRKLITTTTADIVGNRFFVPYPGTPCGRNPKQYGITLLTRDWSHYDRLSFPVYRLDSLSEFEIYYGFLFASAIQLQAYVDRLGIDSKDLSELPNHAYFSVRVRRRDERQQADDE